MMLKRIFADVPQVHPGEYKTVDLAKGEPILNGFSVVYGAHEDVETLLEYDFRAEGRKGYRTMTPRQQVESISDFISSIWQIHPFFEGNTRTVAVFAVQYLDFLGLKADMSPFADHAEYFRNALVRANFSDLATGVERDYTYLQNFFEAVMQ